MMALFSFYLIQIFFDWKDLNLDFDSWKEIENKSSTGFWYKSINCLFFLALYCWTLIAPGILSEREFH